MHFTERASPGGEILEVGAYGTAVHQTMSRHHTVGGNYLFVETEVGTPVFHKHIHFAEGILIEKALGPLASGELSLLTLLCDLCLTAHMLDNGLSLFQIRIPVFGFSHSASTSRMQDRIGTIPYAGLKEVPL